MLGAAGAGAAAAEVAVADVAAAAGVAVAGAAGAGNQSVPSFFIFMTFSHRPGIKSPPFWEAYK